jgi:hypothetical protein
MVELLSPGHKKPYILAQWGEIIVEWDWKGLKNRKFVVLLLHVDPVDNAVIPTDCSDVGWSPL